MDWRSVLELIGLLFIWWSVGSMREAYKDERVIRQVYNQIRRNKPRNFCSVPDCFGEVQQHTTPDGPPILDTLCITHAQLFEEGTKRK